MKTKKKDAFTLIELLAVIVILAIIALIATPIILGIVEDARKDAFLRSVELVVSTTDLDVASKNIQDGYTYEIIDGDIPNLEIGVKNTKGMNGSIIYDKEGNEEYAIHNGVYCVVKKDGEKTQIKDYTGICSLADYLSKECVVLEELPKLGITDKEKCKSNACYALGINDDTSCTKLCNNEPMEGISLTELMLGTGSSTEEMEYFGITSVGYEYKILDYVCADKNIIIPNEIEDLKIVAIGTSAFNNKNLKEVIISEEIKSIENSAFENNQITSIEIPESVRFIGDKAFQNNKLENLQLSNSVTRIGEAAFNNNLLPDNQAFIFSRENSGALTTSIIISYGGAKRDNVVIPNNATGIWVSAFANNQITSITIPNSVTYIRESAFNNNLLPDDQAFIYARNEDGSIDNTELISYGGAKRDSVVIPNNVERVNNKAFANNQLTSVVIPSTVTNIGNLAFANNQLTSVEIPNSVTYIDYEAFANNQLTNITIPESVRTIGYAAFNNNKLSDDQAFIYARNYSDGSIDNTKLVSYGGAKRDSVVIPNSVIYIGVQAFQNNQLTSVEIPNSVTNIGVRAFQNNQLTSIEIPNSVTEIDTEAFANNQLKSVIIKGKTSTSQFTLYDAPFGWATGYNDSNITFENE